VPPESDFAGAAAGLSDFDSDFDSDFASDFDSDFVSEVALDDFSALSPFLRASDG
jgi:hypothetical protein